MNPQSNQARRPDYYSNSADAGDIAQALKSMESKLFNELSRMHLDLQQQPKHDLESLTNVASIQCALDIVQSAKTPEEKATVYDILHHLNRPASNDT